LILVTRGASFLGRTLTRRLMDFEQRVRLLLEPSRRTPLLPRGEALDVAVTSLTDMAGVRAAVIGADTLIHIGLSALEMRGDDAVEREQLAAEILAANAKEAGVGRLIFIGQIGADRASAYPSLRASAIAEEAFQRSGLAFVILRTSTLFGEGDLFTTGLAQAMAIAPLVFPIPGEGRIILQPLWAEDLATGVAWLLEEDRMQDVTYEIGGPEYLNLRDILRLIMRETGILRILAPIRPPYLRWMARLADAMLPYTPLTHHWLDYLAVSRTTDLNALPAALGLAPARMEEHLGYLRNKHWAWEFLRRQRSGGA